MNKQLTDTDEVQTTRREALKAAAAVAAASTIGAALPA